MNILLQPLRDSKYISFADLLKYQTETLRACTFRRDISCVELWDDYDVTDRNIKGMAVPP